MKCLVCGGTLLSYFVKNFAEAFGLGKIDYWRCERCGLVVAKTIHEMSTEEWSDLNNRYHSSFLGSKGCVDDLRWILRLTAQADTIDRLDREGILPKERPWIDYGCGDGKLSDMLSERGLSALQFDRYMGQGQNDYLGEEALKEKYSVVINTSVFEHVREIDTLDEIANLVDDFGVLALHVLVRESIPPDPDWFYLLPVHCTFFTNRSMQILFDRWEFAVSVYHVPSRMWFWFRRDIPICWDFVARQQGRAPDEYYIKKGFMDYWK